jgi:hypothetical protein
MTNAIPPTRAEPELGDPAPLLDELRAQVSATEAAVAAERMRTGGRVLGRRTILQQSWRACPASVEPRRNLRPRVAARSQWSRIEALARNREFLASYREARARWLSGAEVWGSPLGLVGGILASRRRDKYSRGCRIGGLLKPPTCGRVKGKLASAASARRLRRPLTPVLVGGGWHLEPRCQGIATWVINEVRSSSRLARGNAASEMLVREPSHIPEAGCCSLERGVPPPASLDAPR